MIMEIQPTQTRSAEIRVRDNYFEMNRVYSAETMQVYIPGKYFVIIRSSTSLVQVFSKFDEIK